MSDQIEEVKAKTDIVSLISEHIEVKKSGRNYKALCPFHSEKTPSFMVSPELQIFKCFGCLEGGDSIAFLQKYEGMDFPEALKFLADRAGVKLKPFADGQKGIKEKLFQINAQAAHFYKYILLKHAVGKSALKYLSKDRGLKLSTIEKFEIGYSPDRPLALKSYLIDKKGVKIADLEKAGIVYVGDGRTFDRFRGRVIFPLFDHRGNITGFAGRTLPKDESKGLAKYINTPETAVYNKSRMLYPLNVTKASIKKKGVAVVVEGELDAISSWQAGIGNAVATKGTAITQEQVKLISRYAKRLVLALDEDAAGDAAARRGIEIAEKEGLEVAVASLGDFKDPDEMARKDPDGLKSAIKNAKGVWDFIVDSTFARFKEKGGEVKARISREIVPVLSSINDKIVQAHYVQVVARRLGVPSEAVYQQVSGVKVDRAAGIPKVEIVSKDKRKSRRDFLEERMLGVAFRHDPLILRKRRIYSLIRSPRAKRILEEFRRFAKEMQEFDPSEFASKLPGELVEGFVDMALKDIKGLQEASADQYEKEIRLLERELQLINIKDKLKETADKIRELETRKEGEKLQRTKEEFERLTKKLTELEANNFKGIILSTDT